MLTDGDVVVGDGDVDVDELAGAVVAGAALEEGAGGAVVDGPLVDGDVSLVVDGGAASPPPPPHAASSRSTTGDRCVARPNRFPASTSPP